MGAPYASVIDVMLLLTRDDHVLLALRAGTGYADQMWNAPSGKLEAGEDALAALIRESAEEIGIRLTREEPHLVATVHHRNAHGDARLGLFFAVPSNPAAQGEPYNAEPHKCDALGWYRFDALPSNTYPYTTAGLAAYSAGEPYRASGWPQVVGGSLLPPTATRQVTDTV